jgi:hypothetical protein
LEGWIKEWDHAKPERKTYLREVEKLHAISACLQAFPMLMEEAKSDIGYIRQMNPEAFAPPPVDPWPAKNPTPYS